MTKLERFKKNVKKMVSLRPDEELLFFRKNRDVIGRLYSSHLVFNHVNTGFIEGWDHDDPFFVRNRNQRILARWSFDLIKS